MTYCSMRTSLFAVMTGHNWRFRPFACYWGREASRRLWVVHLIEYQLDRVTMVVLICASSVCNAYSHQNAQWHSGTK